MIRTLCLTLLVTLSARAEANDSSVSGSDFPPGDARVCLDVARKNQFPLKQFSALPGTGWDNLRNVVTGQVMAWTYDTCRTNEDGRYLVPDDVFTVPIKTSLIQMTASVYDTWSSVVSTTSKGVNANAGLSFSSVSISGSYSSEKSTMRSKQLKENTGLVLTQLRYLRYKAKIQPGSTLHPAFKGRLLAIAADLDQNLTQSAFYKSQLLVRDYGTHVLTSITAGAGLEKMDFLKRTYMEEKSSESSTVKKSAKASFGSFFKIGGDTSSSSTDTEVKGYQTNVEDSYTRSHGGSIMKPFNMTLNSWVESVDGDLVPMDRSGDPLSFLVTMETLPDLPAPLVDALEENVRRAIEQYYDMNTIRGCTQRDSPNFSYLANLNDNSCSPPNRNLTFGGVYQTCSASSVTGGRLTYDPCAGLNQVNPLTNKYECSEGYTAVLLHTGTVLGRRDSERSCRRCGFLGLRKCCHYNYFQGQGRYTTYWCAATGDVPDESGYLFGGIFSQTSTNLVNRDKKCPPMFYPRRILKEHSICLSDDYELAHKYSVPFGGFMSCSMGNPLALVPDDDKNSLTSYLGEHASAWPKRCPRGYSKHLASIDDGCAVNYCIQTGSLTDKDIPPVRRPPFSSKPASIRRSDVYMIINSVANNSFQGGRQIVSLSAYNEAMKFEVSNDESDTSTHLGSSVAMTVLAIVLGAICI